MEGVGLFVNLSVTLILISILVSIWSLMIMMMMMIEGVLWVYLLFDGMIYRHCRHDDMVGVVIL